MSYVYLIAASSRGPVKIGYANDVVGRLGELQIGNPYRLRVFFAAGVPKASEIEQIAHFHFKAHRLVGEWFKINTDQARVFLLDLFKQHSVAWHRWEPMARDLERRKVQLGEITPRKRSFYQRMVENDREAKAVAERQWQLKEWEGA